MSQPVWVTPAGDLGTIPEGVFYQLPIQAYDPADPDNPNALYYKLIAGSLPDGVQCTKNGLIIGIPKAIASLQGVPAEVPRNVTSKFALRAYTEIVVNGVEIINHVADRTFSLTVTGENPPEFVTPAGNIGTYYDGSAISLQVVIKDRDPSDIAIIRIIAGSLPPGLTIDNKGLISGYIIPLVPITAQAGYSRDDQGFDYYPFDFSSRSASTNYQFTLEASDGKASDIRTFEIYVYSRDSMTADTIDFTADNTFITADESPVRVPFIVNANPSNIGTHRSDNFFAYQFIGLDLDGDTIEYLEHYTSPQSSLPPGLQLDLNTGWLYGYIPDLGASENVYDFEIFVRKANDPDVYSSNYSFSMTVVGQVSTNVIWISPSDLGYIDNGSTSILNVEAYNTGGRALQYSLKTGGVYNKLPQGLSLLSDGSIAGRVSFNTFALDGGTTTFDTEKSTRLKVDPTTFDLKCTFTVRAFSSDGLVSAFKTFSVTINREYNEPYENLYIKAMPPQNDRDLINQLIQNQDIIPPSLVYRPADPNFGVATNVVYNHAYGLTAATLERYVASLDINHYWKNLTLGQVKTAQATDSAGNVIYEVVYSQVIDNLVNNAGLSVSKSVLLPYPVTLDDQSIISTVYPNSLINMRDQVIDTVGQISSSLPLWMLSKQANGQVLGFTPAWVICYTKPGQSNRIAYNIKEMFGDALNTVDFKVDRYELDRLLTKNWDPSTNSWIPTPAETTFDLVPHYEFTDINSGSGYAVGDKILILGTNIGGELGTNNQTITVQEVDGSGGIVYANISGQAPLFSEGNTYTSVAGTNLIGTGTGASFDFVVNDTTATTFDATSLRFEAPEDMYSNTTNYDKYLVFPRHNILV
jgi:hypothetical protein